MLLTWHFSHPEWFSLTFNLTKLRHMTASGDVLAGAMVLSEVQWLELQQQRRAAALESAPQWGMIHTVWQGKHHSTRCERLSAASTDVACCACVRVTVKGDWAELRAEATKPAAC